MYPARDEVTAGCTVIVDPDVRTLISRTQARIERRVGFRPSTNETLRIVLSQLDGQRMFTKKHLDRAKLKTEQRMTTVFGGLLVFVTIVMFAGNVGYKLPYIHPFFSVIFFFWGIGYIVMGCAGKVSTSTAGEKALRTLIETGLKRPGRGADQDRLPEPPFRTSVAAFRPSRFRPFSGNR